MAQGTAGRQMAVSPSSSLCRSALQGDYGKASDISANSSALKLQKSGCKLHMQHFTDHHADSLYKRHGGWSSGIVYISTCRTRARTCATQVFKQTSIFTVSSAAANNESLLAGGALAADQSDTGCFDSDGLLATSDGEQCCAWDYWSGEHDSDGTLSRRQRDRCPTAATS